MAETGVTLDISKRQSELAKVASDIDTKRQQFEDKMRNERAQFETSLKTLTDKQKELQKEYAKFLRTELAVIDGPAAPATGKTRKPRGSGGSIDDEAVIAHLRKAQIEQSAAQIREGVGLGDDVSGNTLSVHLKGLVDSGAIVKEGEKRGTRYRIK
jgi:hypothetical protein